MTQACFHCRYNNITVGKPEVQEGMGITKPIAPHEVSRSDDDLSCLISMLNYLTYVILIFNFHFIYK